MTIRRGTLYAGVFLLAAGGVTLAGAASLIDRTATANAVTALWPLATIGIGAGLLLRRSPAALIAGITAAALPGLALGASVVAAPTVVAVPCTDSTAPTGPVETREGRFGTAGEVDLEVSCGELRLATAPGDGWRIDARNGQDRRTDVTSGATRLSVTSHRSPGRWRPGAGRVDWDVVLPTGPTTDLRTTVNAGRGQLDLAGAHLGSLDLEVNAGEVAADLSSATLERLDVQVNAGSASITLPADGFRGRLVANAGSIELCVPDGLGLRIRSTASLGSVDTGGLVKRGSAWETTDYAAAANQAELAVTASVGSVSIDLEGGCK